MNKSLKRERPLWKIGRKEKVSDIFSKENETEQIFFRRGDGEAIVSHFNKWNTYSLNDF